MNPFEFTLPTKVYFGPGRIDDIGDIFTPGWESTRFSAAVLFNFG